MELKGFWAACEMLVGQSAVEAEWRRLAGEEYEAAKAFLRPMQELAMSYPCTHSHPCGCYHRVVIHGDGDIVAVCSCPTPDCYSIPLTKADIIPYELDRPALYRTIAHALSLEPVHAEISYTQRTVQIGFDSPRPGLRFPVLLSIQTEPEDYRNTAFALAAKNDSPFILVTPTPNLCMPDCQEIVAGKSTALFFLTDMLTVDTSGKMTADPSCKAMLARFHELTLGRKVESPLFEEMFSHSHDFRCVSLGGSQFTLTSSQAQVVEILHKAYRNSTPDVGKDYILEEIGSPSSRLKNLFRSDAEAFKALIRSGKKRGTYRLNI